MPVRDDWKSSQLWKALEARTGNEPAAVRAFLERWMPEIARVLAHGASSPPDFTLHDAEHSYRVAEWMARLMPEAVLGQLSEYEIALLLLSAYLHDIGMTPELGKVRRHRDFLLTGGTSLLTESEERHFQYWLDAAGYGGTHSSDHSRPMDEVVRAADEIITGYTRHRHNDWSEEWIRAHFAAEPLATYEGWIEDVIRLCRSHHEGFEALVGRRFDPRRVGSGAQVVHLRYLAVLLRVADVLDVDRERTPAVVFHHRDIVATSETYWQKDVELTIYLEAGQLSAFARPPRAYLHRAVEETLDAIECELGLCRRLADVTRFEKPVGPGADLPHQWNLQPTLFRNVEPRDGAYQYIDGAFRPNTRKLLELLSGTALYGDPLAAVRELLQNAFDAVRELVAYRRLRRADPSAPALEAQIGALLWVRLSMKQEVDRWWLVCEDEGVGMSREIIRDALLVSGSSPRPEVLELNRRCRTAGFRLGRTGQFGIGALSYFMLADQVVLTTRRANEAGAEQNGWWFESSGVGSFGELRADTSLPHGTSVSMRLRSDIVIDPIQFAARLAHYLRLVLLRVPCNVEFTGPGGASFRGGPGWIVDDAARTNIALSGFHASGEERGFGNTKPESSERRRLRERHDRRWEAIRREAEERLRWETEEGDLPEGMGRYRLRLPYFEVEGGVSLPFIRARRRGDGLILRPVAGGDYELSTGLTAWGWRGIAVEINEPSRAPPEFPPAEPGGLVSAETLLEHRKPALPPYEFYGISAEVDFESADVGTLAVSRVWLDVGPKGLELRRWLAARARRLLETFVAAHGNSPFALLNARAAHVAPPEGSGYQWALSSAGPVANMAQNRALLWGPLPCPLTLDRPGFQSRDRVVWNELAVARVLAMQRRESKLTGRGLHWRWGLHWHGKDTPPDRLVAVEGSPAASAPLWSREVASTPPPFSAGCTSEFPPEWQNLCGAAVDGTLGALIWNLGDPVVQVALGAPEELRKSLGADRWVGVRESALESPHTAALWIMRNAILVSHGLGVQANVDAWHAIGGTAPEFLPRLWKLVLGSSAQADGRWRPVALLRDREHTPEVVTLSPAGALVSTHVPRPAASEWVASRITS